MPCTSLSTIPLYHTKTVIYFFARIYLTSTCDLYYSQSICGMVRKIIYKIMFEIVREIVRKIIWKILRKIMWKLRNSS